MSTLLRDVIDIPERTGADDYVLRLTDSTDDDAHIRATLDQYVLTESLEANFAAALGLVADGIDKQTSRAAFLTGSFGSGKSHFMAVLYALLGNHPAARTSKYTSLTGRYDEQLGGKSILRLTYHLLGAKSLEEAVFRGYLRQIARLHPEAHLPAIHVTDTLIEDAERLRGQIGDAAFLAGLSEGGTAGDSSDAWGAVLGGDTWDLDTYLAAVAAPPEDTRRTTLVSALVRSYYGSFVEQATYVDLDRGLVAITEHAQSLGYDAVVLFLDELVLWLAFSVTDSEFFSRESQKLTKLVESSGSRRPIPLVSFVSRQMDLRKWFADAGASGAEQDALDRAFHYQKERFYEIELGDDNLAEVAHARLLRPRDDAAAAVLDEAFRSVNRSPDVWDVLRDSMNATDNHTGASEREFRLTYPFSPALVATLRHLSSVMQRERTALKVMQRMLVDRRDTLTTADLIPVGDAFDYIVEGNTPIDSHAGTMFTAASDLYRTKLLPILLRAHEVTEEQLNDDPSSVPVGFRAHERIAKTLLLSAVAPKVPALQDITASRLAALNHGSIRSKLRGGEARVVLGVVRGWAKDVPEITVSEGANPIIRVQLSDVDYQSVLDRIRAEDNSGRRRVLIRTLVHRALGVSTAQDDLVGAATRTIIWRGSRREVDVVFGNVRDPGSVPEQSFDNRPGTWKLVVDYPFDEQNFSAADDIVRIDRLLAGGDRHCVAWLPNFFSAKALDDLALLVKLDWLFTGSGERWQENSDHLSASDRAQARGILENLHRGILTSFDLLLRQAYGIEAPDPKMFVDDPGHTEVLISLSKDFSPKLPAALTLSEAFDKVIDQAFTAVYPSHPQFINPSEEVTARQYEVVRDYVERAATDSTGRVPTLPGTERKTVQRVAEPLRVGKATEDHYLFGEDTFAFWAGELDRAAADADRVTVGVLQRRIDTVTPAWGLRPEARDLIVWAWALLRKRAWFDAGAPARSLKLGALRESIELRAEELPDDTDWEKARLHASQLFGYTMPRTFLTGGNVAEFADTVRTKAGERRAELQNVAEQLATAHRALGLDVADSDRLAAVRELSEFLDELAGTGGNVALITKLAQMQLLVAVQTAGQMRVDAGADAVALRSFKWRLLESVVAGRDLGGERGAAARSIVRSFEELIVTPGRSLRDEVGRIEGKVVDWVVDGQSKPNDDDDEDRNEDHDDGESTDAGKQQATHDVSVAGAADVDDLAISLREALAANGSRVRVKWWIE
ncbi:phage resistance protein [Gordonia sp. SMJS1]|nr:phage resistance protein [Gordonia sp. SMJS1]WGJ87755.1 phage resistance protein [Gordonia sp. SMJS1]